MTAEIDRDVPNMARQDANEFALRMAELVVQPPENPFDGEGLVVLNK